VPLVLAQLIVAIVELYAAAGAAFAIVFLWRGVAVVDHRVVGAPVTMRLLIFPGLVAFWPLFAQRWTAGTGEPIERNSHRAKAAQR
jgi:hypothetical protein